MASRLTGASARDLARGAYALLVHVSVLAGNNAHGDPGETLALIQFTIASVVTGVKLRAGSDKIEAHRIKNPVRKGPDQRTDFVSRLINNFRRRSHLLQAASRPFLRSFGRHM
jgi:hypothetical protein